MKIITRRALLDGSLGAFAAHGIAQLPCFAASAEAQGVAWDAALAASRVQQPALADHVLGLLRSMSDLYLGFGVSQLVHATQTATRAMRANAPDEVVLIALVHDIGEALVGMNHAEIAAAMVRPYVSPQTYYALRHHMEFMLAHYGDKVLQPTNMRDRYADLQWFDLAAQFADEFDRPSFDPAYPTQPLEEFEPLVRDIFSRPQQHIYRTALDCA